MPSPGGAGTATAIKSGVKKLTLAFVGVAMMAGMAAQMMPQRYPSSGPTPVQETQTVEPAPQVAVVPPAPAAYVSPVAGVAEHSRVLTAGEAALARQIFGREKMDLDGVRLHFYSGTQAVKSGSHDAANIEIYGMANASADYSAGDAGSYGMFVNELTRLWQNREGEYLRATKAEGADYVLKQELDFLNYGRAQQRAVVQDYALRFFHPSHKTQKGVDTSATDAMLRGMVENRFFAAKESHIALRQTYARDMTADEAALANTFFGKELRTGIVKLYQYPYEQKDALASVESGYGASFWGETQHASDYTKADGARLGTFMHEMTHVWQEQTAQKHTPNQTMRQYHYWLDATSTYGKFSVEQQAAMVQDYVTYFLHPSKSMKYMPENHPKQELPAKAEILKKIVEAQFPGAKALREAIPAQKQAPRLKAPGVA
ncbi:MAG: hypothetical protein ACAH80_15035 [Alphaproteobacteria bacterium]